MAHIEFHPYLNHFPVAFFLLEFLLLILWKRKGEERYERFAYFVLKLAVASMPFVMAAGIIDAHGLPPMVRRHFFCAVALFALNSARVLFRWRRGTEIWTSPWAGRLYFLSAASSAALTVVTGHFGGLLAFD